MKIRRLTTVAEVIDAVGRERLMLITGKRPQNLTNWKAKGFFPPETFLVVGDELKRIDCQAPPSLWRILVPARRRAA